jgi:hypothetical protein
LLFLFKENTVLAVLKHDDNPNSNEQNREESKANSHDKLFFATSDKGDKLSFRPRNGLILLFSNC